MTGRGAAARKKVSDLLVQAGLISQEQLNRALPASRRDGVPVGRVLVDTGVVPAATLRAGVLAQTLIRENLVPPDLAAEALKLAHAKRISLEQSLESLGWRTEKLAQFMRLGQLLTNAGVIDDSELNNAVEACLASGLPLSRVLILRKTLPESLAEAALSAQRLVKEGTIAHEQAVLALATAALKNESIDSILEESGQLRANGKRAVRLGELLVSAGMLSELDLLSAVEQGMLDGKPLGQVLISTGLLSAKVLEKALELQKAVNDHLMEMRQAATLLCEFDEYAVGIGPSDDLALDFSGLSREMREKLMSISSASQRDVVLLVQQLLSEKQNLAFKVVNEQEELKNRLARDLHDTIIADLMMLKRYLSGDKKLSVEQIVEIVDHVVRQLRDICNDFSPRHLKEWGLKMCVQDQLDRMKQRTGIKVSLECLEDLPVLPDTVELHTFRIIQECLNNVEKYAQATEVGVRIENLNRHGKQLVRFTVVDDGKGFDVDGGGSTDGVKHPESGGMGLGAMRQRANLMCCFFPTRLDIDSATGVGSRTILEITYR